MIPNRDKEREILSKKADNEDYAIETGTITFDNGVAKIVIKGDWKCNMETINSQGKKISEVHVLGEVIEVTQKQKKDVIPKAINDLYFTCKCPLPDKPGHVHRVPIDCIPLKKGETIKQWKKRVKY